MSPQINMSSERTVLNYMPLVVSNEFGKSAHFIIPVKLLVYLPFLFYMYLNDVEDEFYLNGIEGIDIHHIKLFLLLYADDITLFSETAEGLQRALNLLYTYRQRWKLSVNTNKTKVMVFRKGGILPRDLKFYYNGIEIEIVNTFSYLGIVFFLLVGHFRIHKSPW